MHQVLQRLPEGRPLPEGAAPGRSTDLEIEWRREGVGREGGIGRERGGEGAKERDGERERRRERERKKQTGRQRNRKAGSDSYD